jgi:hypothetical protein
MEFGFKVTADDVPKVVAPVLQCRYQRVIGALIFITEWTRPDCLYDTIALACHCAYPSQIPITAALRVLLCPKTTKRLGISPTNERK